MYKIVYGPTFSVYHHCCRGLGKNETVARYHFSIEQIFGQKPLLLLRLFHASMVTIGSRR